jgi:hypothetical protein
MDTRPGPEFMPAPWLVTDRATQDVVCCPRGRHGTANRPWGEDVGTEIPACRLRRGAERGPGGLLGRLEAGRGAHAEDVRQYGCDGRSHR